MPLHALGLQLFAVKILLNKMILVILKHFMFTHILYRMVIEQKSINILFIKTNEKHQL